MTGGESATTVLVDGKAPSLESVLRGEHGPPFEKQTFHEYAKKQFFVESIEFWESVEAFRASDTPDVDEADREDLFRIRSQRLFDKYVAQGSPMEVNISSQLRSEVESSLTGSIDYSMFDEAQQAVVTMVSRDQYARFVDGVVVEHRVKLAKSEALWWKEVGGSLTLREFFSFPNPVNEADSRLHNWTTAILLVVGTLLYSFLGIPWVFVGIAYGFFARVLAGPRIDPQAFFVLFILNPIICDRLHLLHNKFVAGPPKRFAQSCGLLFSSLLIAFSFLEIDLAVWITSGVFFAAAFMAGALDFCVACAMFQLAAAKGLLPASLCQECTLTFVGNTETGGAPNSPTRSCKMQSPKMASGMAVTGSKTPPMQVDSPRAPGGEMIADEV